jgi:hypothetical protein
MDASLAERLAAFAEAVRTQRPDFSDAVERLVRRLRESGVGICGGKAPSPSRSIGAIGALLPDQHQCSR